MLLQGDFHQALTLYDNAIHEKPTDSGDIYAFALFGKAQVNEALGESTLALDNAKKALAILERMGHHASVEVRKWIEHRVQAA
jgi:tetratricopeptide (TPR) repeat protein